MSAKLIYECIINASSPLAGSRLLSFIWNNVLPRQICYFIWLALKNKLLTWDNLQKQGWTRPGICVLCRIDTESIEHLFYYCPVWKNLLSVLLEKHYFSPPRQSYSLCSFLDMWTVSFTKHSGYCYLPFLAMWTIWKVMNVSIFEAKTVPIISLLHQISYSLQLYCPTVTRVKKHRAKGPGPTLIYPCGFFDGASVNNTGGVGFCLHLNELHSFEFALGVAYLAPTLGKN